MEFLTASDAWFGRVLFERGLAALYLIAFVVAKNQFPALLGERGLLPVPEFLRKTNFASHPSIFHWRYSDRFFALVAWIGILVSIAILCGAMAKAPVGVPVAVWLFIAFLYLSIVNVGQRFYSFGWETMLVEAGFFAAFLDPEWMQPSILPILMLRWMLFRVELGAGLIKIRAGGTWKDRTALYYHHETQPMPNPLSRIAHLLIPKVALRGGVVFSHFVQIIVPFGLFLPQSVAGIAGGLIIFHQMLLIIFGNYSWLNWLTVVLAFSTLPDAWFGWIAPMIPVGMGDRPLAWEVIVIAVFLLTAYLSVPVVKNLCSRRQLMNSSFNRWRIVNTYGAFGSVTKERYEIIIEGTADNRKAIEEEWLPYEFKGKPGNPIRIPPIVAPYHLRLDWLMWFLPLRVPLTATGIAVRGYEDWFIEFVKKLLQGEEATLRLIKENPFPDKPPKYIRARFFRYTFAPMGSGKAWDRKWIGDYLEPVDLENLSR